MALIPPSHPRLAWPSNPARNRKSHRKNGLCERPCSRSRCAAWPVSTTMTPSSCSMAQANVGSQSVQFRSIKIRSLQHKTRDSASPAPCYDESSRFTRPSRRIFAPAQSLISGTSATWSIGLRVRSAWLGDADQGRVSIMRVLDHRNVTKGDDADEAFVPVQHRQAPDLNVRHIVCHTIEVLVLIAVLHLRAHDLSDGSSRPLPSGNGSESNVTVGDHSHQPITLTDRQDPGVNLGHHLGRVLNGHPAWRA